jgi:general secretion pathway protein K
MPRSPGAARRERGVALLVAIASIAILTAIGVELAYETRVSLQLAANARDELRATYLAKSAVSVSRLVLYFQHRLDTMGAMQIPGLQTPGGGARLSLRLWDLVPLDSSAAALFLGGEPGAGRREAHGRAGAAAGAAAAPGPGAGPQAGAAGERRLFGDAEGSFHATIEDEERKINVRQLSGLGIQPYAQAVRFARLVQDPKYDFLFDQDDANGIRVSRKDLLGALKDFEDEDETSDAFTDNPAKPFENGFGDENGVYDRLPDRYKAKNAPFDSLDELYLVAGVSDAFMAAFGERLTVYPDVNATINVNTSDPQQLMVNALLMADPPGVPQTPMLDPAFMQKLGAALALARPLPFLSITPQQFATILEALGVKVRAEMKQAVNSDARNPFGDVSSTFHIHAVGVAGDVKKSIDAVVTFDNRAGALAQDAGKLLHWNEE